MMHDNKLYNNNISRSGWFLLFLAVGILDMINNNNIGFVDGFQVSNQHISRSFTQQQQHQQQPNLFTKTDVDFSYSVASSSALDAAKKKKSSEPEPEREKTNLLLLYMTPWKNPNSIFVYMLLILWALGTYSEAHR